MSEIQVNTINEYTGASGVTIDGLLIKDGAIPSIPGGKVLQVVSAISSTAQDTTSNSYIDITNLSLSITPSSTNNDILIMYSDSFRTTHPNDVSSGTGHFQLLRDTTSIATGINLIYNSAGGNGSNSIVNMGGLTKLDSPSTTSSVTYKMQMKASTNSTAGSQHLNNTASLIAMEVSG